METVYRMKRSNLRWLMQQHPTWTCQQLAEVVEMSLGWVKKWRRRLRESEPDDEQVLHSRSRAPKHPRARISEEVVARVLALRDEPPEGLRRVPGPKALAYYLPRDPELQQLQVQGHHLPRSTRCIYLILKRAARIAERPGRHHEPLERPEPLQEWQLDFKDASSVPANPEGKQQHVVEVLNIIDVGTSILLDAHVAADFHAETALQAIVQTFQRWGRPRPLTTDRDVRLVGSPQGSDFPSALRRLCSCLGIDYVVCPPQRPDRNAFVERYHRSFQQECLSLEQPHTLREVAEATSQFVEHYNHQRPNQALTCHNQPPAVAHPDLPVLPSVPLSVDPDGWLRGWDGWQVRRLVSAPSVCQSGCGQILCLNQAGWSVDHGSPGCHREAFALLAPGSTHPFPAAQGAGGRSASLVNLCRHAESNRLAPRSGAVACRCAGWLLALIHLREP